ncbi:DUF1731 domain-containing protein [Streptomyces cellulosae]
MAGDVLGSARVLPTRLLESGFRFAFPEIVAPQYGVPAGRGCRGRGGCRRVLGCRRFGSGGHERDTSRGDGDERGTAAAYTSMSRAAVRVMQ